MVGSLFGEAEAAKPADGDILPDCLLHLAIRVVFPELDEEGFESLLNIETGCSKIAIAFPQRITDFLEVDDGIELTESVVQSYDRREYSFFSLEEQSPI